MVSQDVFERIKRKTRDKLMKIKKLKRLDSINSVIELLLGGENNG
jgi:hypothetical protein